MVNIYIENYGCVANYDNGAIIAGLLKEYNIVKDIDKADIVIINSCAVKNVTVNKIFSKIKSVKDKKTIVTGCMPLSEREKLEKYNVSLVSTQNITEIPKIIDRIMNNEQVILVDSRNEIKLGFPKLEDKEISTVQIAEGCLSSCTFCSTKLAKGNLVSYPKEDIIKEVKKYVDKGCKRINLTATDSACYGFDLDYNLVDLLREVVEIEGDFIVRVGMGNPKHVINYVDDLVEVFKNDKIMKFIHIPLQSGSDKVLEEMGRNHSVKDFIKIVSKFRENIPGISISTDLIVGYPTETEEDFKKTVELVKKLKFEVLNISKFASRPNTYASKLKPLKSQKIKERSVELSKVWEEVKQEQV